ncbi:MAG TPA: CHASE3 domain-containing protein [Methyloceanibacter sp.]|nr:CHASE3 domain-containing protein [Methyloceanibacter sp.]
MPTRAKQAERLLRNARIIIPAGFFLVLAAVIAVVIGLIRSRAADEMVVHTFEVQQAAQAVLVSVRDAETTKRSYLLTGDSDYLESVATAMQTIPLEISKLSELVADNPARQEDVRKLEKLIEAKLVELRETLLLVQDGQKDAALAILNSPQSRQLIGDIREKVGEILNKERTLLTERQASRRQDRYLLAGLVGLALLFATLLAAILAGSTLQAVKGLVARTKELEAESKLRHEAEDTLRQAQKMEAVGQLTGGIAHDFNNLLTIILGNLDTMRRQVAAATNPGDIGVLIGKMTKPLDAAMQGTKSAAQLTQRLLAFARRQPLEPVRVDMNRLITGMLDLLRRTLGEEISIETVFAAALWPVEADPHQLENVLLNLALNAKDSMPDGGCLTIETANTYLDDAYVRRFGDVAAGQYAVICVTDTGHGIPEEIIDQVFEPFFTTKPHGEGSGLGLAMVHGFVKQSGGHVRIYSEKGQGTTVKIYLPRMIGAEEARAVPAGKPEGDFTPMPKAKPGEVILLVEDNDGVRAYAKGVLEELGYWVIEAANAEQAMRALAKKPRIDLSFTDVVLPGESGRELADRVKRLYPHVPVLYTTGYTRNAIVHQGRLDPNINLLSKPYTQQDLARKLRELLDAVT